MVWNSSGVASSASTTRRASTAALSRTGWCTIGPTPGSIEKGTPMPYRGSMMSAYSTAPSTPKVSTGMVVTCAHSSGVLVISRIP